MTYLLVKMLFCLLLATILGIVLGWLWHRFLTEKKYNAQVEQFKSECDQHQQDKAPLESLLDGKKQKGEEEEEEQEDLCAMDSLKEQLIVLTKDRDQIQAKISQLSAELSTEKQCIARLTEENRMMRVAAEPDDLKKIIGIGTANEQALKKQGITCYAQIAAFNTDDEKKYGNTLGVFSGRIRQEEWVKQAKKLHQEKYSEDL